MALAAKARRLVLSHVSARYSISAEELVKEAREVFKETAVAKDGMTIEVPFADWRFGLSKRPNVSLVEAEDWDREELEWL